jgi:hypothetical protein
MTFPNCENSIVQASKISEYLLNLQHTVGQHKAKFFMAFGFELSNPNSFSNALIEQGQTQTLTVTKATQFGTIFSVDCHIQSPDGRNPCIRTVWELRTNSKEPRLITAFPN